jgi:DNA-binding transcriptional ArsR family regulator
MSQNLSCGAKRLFHHLKFLCSLRDGAIKFQRTLAAMWKVTTRTVRRWLTELKGAGLLAAIVRRGRTSARYELDPEMSTRMSTQEPQNVHSKRPSSLISSPDSGVSASPLRKPPEKARKPWLETWLNYDSVAKLMTAGVPYAEAVRRSEVRIA